MSLKTSKKIDTNRYELEVKVSAEEFEKAIQKVFKKQAKNIAIPGFRKGKAPRTVIERYYGSEIFFEDAVNEVYPKALETAIDEAELDFIEDKIDFDVKEMSKEAGLTFTAAITTKPEVKIENYKGIETNVVEPSVSPQDIEQEIDYIRERNARTVSVEDRAAQNEDITVIDFKGFVDGETFEGGESENFSLTLGSGQFIPGFEEQIIGHNIGEEFDVNVKFPEEYHAEDLKGKDAVFKCKLHEIKTREIPALDDEFVKDVSEVDTVEEYKKEVEKKLLETKNKDYENEVEKQISAKLAELLEAEIPQAMFENKIQQNINDFAYRLKNMGMDLKTYMHYMGEDLEKLKDSFRERSEQQVKTELALEKIANMENIEASEERIEKELESIAEKYNMSKEEVKSAVPEKELIKDILNEEAFNLVKKESKNIEPTDEVEEEKNENKNKDSE